VPIAALSSILARFNVLYGQVSTQVPHRIQALRKLFSSMAPGGLSTISDALDVKKIAKNVDGVITDKPDINKAQMGVAVIDQESCLAFWGIQCDACYRACPLIGEAITLNFNRNERTGKHAFLEPVVHKEVCTGCGLCEHACITEKPAIFVLPRELAMGKVGEHYIKGWDKKDEERLKNLEKEKINESAPEDILNDWEDLLDDK